MTAWFKLSESERLVIINQVSIRTKLLPVAVEKDLWVMIALRAIFNTEIAEHLVFKGGTSLSKAWNIIERFSEDIDLAIDRSFFGFNHEMTKSQVVRLRKTSCKYISETYVGVLEKELIAQVVKEFQLKLTDFEDSDTDPLAIEIEYNSIVEKQEYLKPRILVEISSRSLKEPFEVKKLSSLIRETYPEAAFADEIVNVPTVLPSRTLLEKMFLLHEEFQKPKKRPIRSSRMTRHLYDINRLMNTEYLELAINDKELYKTIVTHRKTLTKISWVDYSTHDYPTLNFIPPPRAMEAYRSDYRAMEESMFYGETIPFDKLMENLKGLNERMNGFEGLGL
jgi:hypothetical protein